MRGYKAMNEDMTCRGYQFEIGKTYEADEPIEICESGFHFCQKITDTWKFYDRFCRVFEVEASGEIQQEGDKLCASRIKIIKEVEGVQINRLRYGDGYGNGCGYGDGYGDGYGNGCGYGCGYGDGYGDGYGNGCGYGYGDGYGYGNGYGDGYGFGYGDGNGCGYGVDINKILEFLEG